jgi:hypothetical protein
MQEFCHRCGGDLASGSSPFCPHCGAPQLFLTESARSPADPDASSMAVSSTGALPPPRPHQIEWHTAIRCAALVAAIGALLSLVATRLPFLSPLSSLWILSASLLTLSLYQRRRPLAWMDAAIGARIGVVAGLSLDISLAIVATLSGLIARFKLNAMGSFDAQINQLLDQITTQLNHSAPGNPELPAILHFITTPEFRAGYALTVVAVTAIILLLLSVLAGALAGLVRTRRRSAA